VSGGHTHTDHGRPGRTAVRAALIVLGVVAAATAVAMFWLWPGDRPEAQPAGIESAAGTVVAVESEPCPDSGDVTDSPGATPGPSGCGTATIAVEEGPGAGQEVEAPLPAGLNAIEVGVGDDVTLDHFPDEAEGQGSYQIADHQRGTELWVLGAAFALAVVAFGRLRGLTALAGLAVTFAVLLFFVVPAILDGRSPLLVAIVGSVAIMLVVLYLTHGLNTPTTIAVIGTLVSLVLTGLLAAAATGLTHLTGVADENSNYLSLVFGVDMRGLLLASILIGSLGVLDDVTVTQSATVVELAKANPAYGFARLYRAATRIGRSHIASVINTIILAYAGASLPVLILIAAADRPAGQVLTTQVIAQELVRSAVGTIGLIAAVPVTTALAAFVAHRFAGPAPEPDVPADVPGPRPIAAKGAWLEMYETDDEPPAATPRALPGR